MAITERQMMILKAIIDDYIATGIPVGSRTLSKRMDMSISPPPSETRWRTWRRADTSNSPILPPGGCPRIRPIGYMWIRS